MFIWIQILMCLSIISTVYFSVTLFAFNRALYKKRTIREKKISFKGIKDFCPKEIRLKLEESPSIVKRDINKFLYSYKMLLSGICAYCLMWILYLALIILRISWIFREYKTLEKGKLVMEIGSILMGILIIYWLFLIPIFERLQLKKCVKIGLMLWDFLQIIVEEFIKYLKTIYIFIFKVIVSLIISYAYFWIVEKILEIIQYKVDFLGCKKSM